jgi:hypothetical protein
VFRFYPTLADTPALKDLVEPSALTFSQNSSSIHSYNILNFLISQVLDQLEIALAKLYRSSGSLSAKVAPRYLGLSVRGID